MSNKKGQAFDLINRSPDLVEARQQLEDNRRLITTLSIANSQLKAQITGLNNALADSIEDLQGMKDMFLSLTDDDGMGNEL